MTMLSVVQDFCKRTGLPKPATVMGTTDPQITQVMALLEEEGDDLSRRAGWQGITFEASLTTTATESQGAMDDIATNGFNYIKNDTIWSRSRRLPVCGPLDAKQWQMLKALFVNGPYYRFRIRGNELLVNPTPPASEAWYFEYVSKNWIVNGTSYYNRFAADDDEVLLPENLVLQGLRWRWKKEKGLEYAEDYNTYEMQVKDAIGRDGGKPILHMDDKPMNGPAPGIFVPTGSWNV